MKRVAIITLETLAFIGGLGGIFLLVAVIQMMMP